ncbi:MAG: CDP-paratose 2-epimerase [Pseudonocardiales bacterium]|jgi:CDP-paratose 2-epimerase|nr:CDP-paratose 2-epimerase [Pseudonocardiales bacterium]
MSRPTLITGGAGFIGTNMASRLLDEGREVVVLDNLSRPSVRDNLQWLHENYPHGLRMVQGDVRDAEAVRNAVRGVGEIFHFAAQVAVTTSVTDPLYDFGVNLGGTLTLLEEVRRMPTPPTLLFTSTNKVYGSLNDVRLIEGPRYEPAHAPYRDYGVAEDRPLSFCSPYGCSKGGADQYVLDFGMSYDLPTVVFRMSCIYGPHQQGNEDQGWVAHFVKRALGHTPITLYGDGRQVRDLLYVEDLLDALQSAVASIDRLHGKAYNMGGGSENAVSLLQVLDEIAALSGQRPEVDFDGWRIGDQRWYVSDTRRFGAATGWAPQVDVADGIKRLYAWLEGQDCAAMAES